jgi:hypothetical protein
MHPFKPVKQGLVGRDLRRSDGCPGEREKRDDDVPSAAIITQPDNPAIVAF